MLMDRLGVWVGYPNFGGPDWGSGNVWGVPVGGPDWGSGDTGGSLELGVQIWGSGHANFRVWGDPRQTPESTPQTTQENPAIGGSRN